MALRPAANSVLATGDPSSLVMLLKVPSPRSLTLCTDLHSALSWVLKTLVTLLDRHVTSGTERAPGTCLQNWSCYYGMWVPARRFHCSGFAGSSHTTAVAIEHDSCMRWTPSYHHLALYPGILAKKGATWSHTELFPTSNTFLSNREIFSAVPPPTPAQTTLLWGIISHLMKKCLRYKACWNEWIACPEQNLHVLPCV